MKKVLAISLALLIMFTGVTVNVAVHYCGGMIAAKKVSLSGELASCGMARQEVGKPGINNTPVCSNSLSAYMLNNNFVSSLVLSIDFVKMFSADAETHAVLVPGTMPDLKDPAFNNRPPGSGYPNDVRLECICIYRI
jgi:hypothetical protein